MQDKSYVIVRSREQLEQMIYHIQSGDIIAYDTETNSLNPRSGKIIGFSVSANIGEGFYFPTWLWDADLHQLYEAQIDKVPCDTIAKKLISLLLGKRLVMHNGSFDIRFTKNHYGVDLRNDLYCDTMLLRHTLKEDGPLGLKPTAIELQNELGLDAEKDANEEQIALKESIHKNGGSTTKDNYEIFKADLEILGYYAVADTDLTLRIMTYYLPILKEQELWDFFFNDEVMPLYKTVTIQMEEVGTELDIDLMEETNINIEDDLRRLEDEIVEDLLELPAVRDWVMLRAADKFPPKKRGKFVEQLMQYDKYEDRQGVDAFLETGDPAKLHDADFVRTSMALLKEKEGAYINISSKKQLAEICFNHLQIKPLSQTRKGSDQFNDALIEQLSSQYTWAAKLRDYNKLNKIKSAYIDRFLDGQERGRYYWYFKQHGTTSGRYSSDCQQFPRVLEEGEVSPLVLSYNNTLRSFLIAERGRKFVICDQSSLEPRVFASVSNDPALINVFLDNEDLYSRVAIQAFKLKGMSAKKSDPNYVKTLRPELRQRAKSIALAIPYGAGAWQIGKALAIHPSRAQVLIDDYLEGFPDLARWMQDTKLRVQTLGIIKSKTGRIRHLERAKLIYDKFEDSLLDPKAFGMMKRVCKTQDQLQKLIKLRVEYKNALNNAQNFTIQSWAASIMNRSAIAIHKEFKEKQLDAHIMLQIHDEFVVNCKEEIAKEVASIVKYHMENTEKIPTGLVAIPSIVDNFGTGHE